MSPAVAVDSIKRKFPDPAWNQALVFRPVNMYVTDCIGRIILHSARANE